MGPRGQAPFVWQALLGRGFGNRRNLDQTSVTQIWQGGGSPTSVAGEDDPMGEEFLM